MEANIIVLILTLVMPNGNQSVTVQPMQTADVCIAQAQLEIADPFVAQAECAALEDGKLELHFGEAPELERKAQAQPGGSAAVRPGA